MTEKELELGKTIEVLNKKIVSQQSIMLKMTERMCFPPITETQVNLRCAIEILDNVPKRSRYYSKIQDAIKIIKNEISGK